MTPIRLILQAPATIITNIKNTIKHSNSKIKNKILVSNNYNQFFAPYNPTATNIPMTPQPFLSKSSLQLGCIIIYVRNTELLEIAKRQTKQSFKQNSQYLRRKGYAKGVLVVAPNVIKIISITLMQFYQMISRHLSSNCNNYKWKTNFLQIQQGAKIAIRINKAQFRNLGPLYSIKKKHQSNCKPKIMQLFLTKRNQGFKFLSNKTMLDDDLLPVLTPIQYFQLYNHRVMSSRYQKPSHLLVFQQKSHYQHIQNPRATIRIDPQSRKSHSLHFKTKSTNEKERQRRMQNKKMLLHLLQIYNGQGLLSRMEQSSKQVDERRNKSLMRSFKKIQQEKEIRKENKELMVNIQNAEPIIGNQRDWNKHFQNHVEIQKKLCVSSIRNVINMSAFKTFYHHKKRRLISEQKASSMRASQEKMETKQLNSAKKQRRKHTKRKVVRQYQPISIPNIDNSAIQSQ